MGEEGRGKAPGAGSGIGEDLGWEDLPTVVLSLTKQVGGAGSTEDQPEQGLPPLPVFLGLSYCLQLNHFHLKRRHFDSKAEQTGSIACSPSCSVRGNTQLPGSISPRAGL